MCRWAATGALVLAALCLPPAATAQPVSSDRVLFAEDLESLSARVGNAAVTDIPDLIASLPAEWIVEDGGEPVRVSSAWISRALQDARSEPDKWSQQRAAIVARLNAVKTEAETLGSQGSAPDVERSQRVVAEVLARDEFRRNADDGALGKLRRRITDWWLALWDRMGGNRLGTRKATTVIAWVAGLSALSALTWWLLSRVLAPARRTGLALTAPAPRRRSARAWAKEAAAAQDPRDAIRCAYRAALATLEEEGAWRADDARTPREHLRLLSSGHRRRPIFADVARRFEEVWFGARTPSSDDTRAVLSRLEELGCLRGP